MNRKKVITIVAIVLALVCIAGVTIAIKGNLDNKNAKEDNTDIAEETNNESDDKDSEEDDTNRNEKINDDIEQEEKAEDTENTQKEVEEENNDVEDKNKKSDDNSKEKKESKSPVITTKNDTVTKSIPYETIKENDSTIEKGIEKVDRNGEEGTREIVYEITYTDGKQTNKKEISNKVIKEPVDKIIFVGTKEPEPEPDDYDAVLDPMNEAVGSGYTVKRGSGGYELYRGEEKVGWYHSGGIVYEDYVDDYEVIHEVVKLINHRDHPGAIRISFDDVKESLRKSNETGMFAQVNNVTAYIYDGILRISPEYD